MALRNEEFHHEAEKRTRSTKKKQSPQGHRLTITLSDDLYEKIEVEAQNREQSLREYIFDILSTMRPPDGYDIHHPRPITPESLARALEVRQQIIEETNGHIFEDSTKLIRRMRGDWREESDS